MHLESPTISLTDLQSSIHLSKNVVPLDDANEDCHSLPATCDVLSQTPEKKPTRQWAAWTRQEEESFFNALRQVGKNFEKITSSVQSKNKDQVRHYYYRLIKRMNKLLGPAFSLDAKNSTDANAAMLRWWSLLEKHSCSASKLHLKPRRFKTFVAALKHQLLKDRKKVKRKCSQTILPVSVPSKSAVNETHGQPATFKNHEVHTAETGRGNLPKRSMLTGTSCFKDEMVKPARHRRKAGGSISSNDYKRWEKAAMVGVSLVADAAAQLEHAANKFPSDVCLDELPCKSTYSSGEHRNLQIDYVDERAVPPSRSATIRCTHEIMRKGLIQRHMVGSTDPGKSTVLLSEDTKLKLQLFPIDDCTRKGMEKDGHNPYLELTVRAQKKISSVIEHLSRKWGNSSIASGELMLFPYATHQGYVASQHRWTVRDSISARDVSVALGNPSVSRLRYGWFSGTEPCLLSSGQFSSHILDACLHSDKENLGADAKLPSVGLTPSSSNHDGKSMDKNNGSLDSNRNASDTLAFNGSQNDKFHSVDASNNPEPASSDHEKNLIGVAPIMNNLETSPLGNSSIAWLNEESAGAFIENLFQDESNMQQQSRQRGVGATFASAEWVDSVTNYSMGGLLSQASFPADAVNPDLSAVTGTAGLHPTQFCSDSVDAAIAAHMSRHQNVNSMSLNVSQSSIWDAEDTRDAFSFKKNQSSLDNVCHSSRSAPTEKGSQSTIAHVAGSAELVEDFSKAHCNAEAVKTDPVGTEQNQEGEKNFGILDAYWPDSLGYMLDFGFSSSRLQNQCLLNADNLSGLGGLFASSLDAFQNCSFFGAEKVSSQ